MDCEGSRIGDGVGVGRGRKGEGESDCAILKIVNVAPIEILFPLLFVFLSVYLQ